MAVNDRDQKIRQLKEKLEMCKEFIKNEPKEAQKELAECQQDYQEACRELDKVKKEYLEDLKQAEIEHYSDEQMQNMERLFQEEIATAEEYKNKMFDYLEKAQEHMKKLPELLEQAKAEQKSIEEELAIYDTGISGPPAVIGGAIIWIIVFFLLFKACGG